MDRFSQPGLGAFGGGGSLTPPSPRPSRGRLDSAESARMSNGALSSINHFHQSLVSPPRPSISLLVAVRSERAVFPVAAHRPSSGYINRRCGRDAVAQSTVQMEVAAATAASRSLFFSRQPSNETRALQTRRRLLPVESDPSVPPNRAAAGCWCDHSPDSTVPERCCCCSSPHSRAPMVV